jgi:hypothetical protein
MSSILKYSVRPRNEVQLLTIPASSEIVSAIEQNGEIVVYALVPDPDAPPLWDGTKRLLVVGTGWGFNLDREKAFDKIRFINTVKIGPFVWHVMELVELREDDRTQN